MADNSPKHAGWRGLAALSSIGPVWSDRAILFVLAVYPLMAMVRAWTISDDVIFVLCAIAAVGSLQRGSGLLDARVWASSFARPAGVLAILLTLYAFLSLFWTKFTPDYGPIHLAKTVAMFALATVLAKRFSAIPNRKFHQWFAVTTAIALVVLGIDGSIGHKLAQFFYGAAIDRRVNPSVVSLSLLLWPALAALIFEQRKVTAALLWGLAGAIFLVSSSQAAFAGYVVGTAMLLVSWRLPRAAVWIATAGAVAGVLLAPLLPWAAGMMTKFLPKVFIVQSSALDRIDHWSRFAALIMDAPFLGGGALSLGKTHPHNFPQQIWVEFGFVGAALTAALLIAAGFAISRLDERYRPFALALGAAAYMNAFVSYGLWEIQFLAIMILPVLVVIHGAHSVGGAQEVPNRRGQGDR